MHHWFSTVYLKHTSLPSPSCSVRAVYDELHNTLMAIDEQEDLRWWKNTYGPGMPTDWPHFQVSASASHHLRPPLILH